MKELENPKYLRLAEELNEKFREKEAHEEADITQWTGATVFTLHTLIWGVSLSVLFFLDVTKAERIFLLCVCGVAGIGLEYLKSRYMERFFHAYIKSTDLRLSKNVRLFNDKKMVKNRTIMFVFWAVSAFILTISAIKYSNMVSGTADKLPYDNSLKASLNAKINALETARQNGAGITTLKTLSNDVEKASKDWQNHTANIDVKNNALVDDHGNTVWFYAGIAILLGILLEGGLFYMRGFHEKEQYRIAMSVNEALGQTETEKESTGVEMITIEKKYLLDLESKYNKFAKENELLKQEISKKGDFADSKELKIALARVKELETLIAKRDDDIKDLVRQLDQTKTINTALERLVKP